MDDKRTDRQTDGGACLYYKLTYEPNDSGELINKRLTYRTGMIGSLFEYMPYSI